MKVVRVAVQIIGAIATVASFIPGPHQAIAAAVAAIATAASAALAITASKPRPTRGGSATDFQSDTQAGIPYLIGRTASGGNIVRRDTWGTDNQYEGFLVIYGGGGPYQELEAFQVDQATVAFDGTGTVTTAGYVGDKGAHMWLRTQRGLCPEPAALQTTGWTAPGAGGAVGAMPGQGAGAKLSGLAAALWALRFDKSGGKYPNGVPAPLAIWKAALVYDPRLDSTYPGGAGACRPLDESTYVWSENPYLHALTWALGRWQNAKRVMGIGMALASIDLPAYVEAANIADANGWKIGGRVTSLDDKWNVLKLMCQAGGGEPIKLGARLSVMVSAPRVSIVTIESGDLIGTGQVVATQSRRERINTVTPRIKSESHGWQVVPLDPVTSATYVAEDGGERSRELPLELVQEKNQGAQLAAYDIVNAREFGPITLPLRIRFIGVKPGDCVTVNIPELGLTAQPCIVTLRTLDPESAAVSLEMKSETPAKHAFALGRTGAAPPTPDLVPDDISSVNMPGAAAWAAIAYPLIGPGGTTSAIQVNGAVDNWNAESVIFEYRVHGTADWQQVSTEVATVTSKLITGLALGESYDIAVSYLVRGVIGARRVLGPVVAPGAVSTTFVGAGDLATLDTISFGDGYLLETVGGTVASLPAFRTNLGTAAAIAGQGAYATLNSAAYGTSLLTGFGTLAPRNNVRLQNEVYRADGATVLTDAAAVTSLGTAAAISGQGAFATLSSAGYGTSLLTGFGLLAPLSQVNIGAAGRVYRDDGTTRLTDALAVTSLGTAAAISGQGAYATLNSAAYGTSLLTGFGALAPLSQVNIGAAGRVYRDDGATRLTDALAVTSLGTAAAISGQGAFATLNSAAYGTSLLTGFGALAPLSQVNIGAAGRVYRDDGATRLTDALAVTSLGTAAAIAGQAAIATDNDAVARILSMRGDNLIRNPMFQEGSSGYYIYGAGDSYVDPDTYLASPHPSNTVIWFPGTAQASGFYANNAEEIPVTGRTLSLSLLCRALGAAGTAIDLGARCKDADGNILSFTALSFPGPAPGAWGQLKGKIALPATTCTVAIYVQRTASGYGVAITGLRAAFSSDGADVTTEQAIVSRLDAATGRASDPRILNTQLLIGPSSSTNIAPTQAVGGSNVTVTIPSHSRKVAGPSGPVTLSYGAGSGTVAFNVDWFCYVDDATLAGIASPSYVFTTDPANLLYPGRYHVASGHSPTAGGTGGSVGGGGGGGWGGVLP